MPSAFQSRQGAQTQKVHLEESDAFHRRTIILRDQRIRSGCLIEWKKVDQRLIRDDHPCRMDPDITRHALQPPTDIDDALYRFVFGIALLEFRLLLERLVQRHLQFAGDQFREIIRLFKTQTQHPRHILDHRFRFERAEGNDLRDVAILIANIIKHLGASHLADIQVNIRHFVAIGIHKSFEVELVANGIGTGNVEAIGDHRAATAAPRSDGYAFAAGVVHAIPNDQKVTRETLAGDDF